ncbi:VOC family protein [Corynebacterium pyruviciproducens]
MPVLTMPEGTPSALVLYTTDKQATVDFFSSALGYGLDERVEGAFLTLESIPIATVVEADFNAWSVGFTVGDLADAHEQVTRAGGRVLSDTQCLDPAGVPFSLLTGEHFFAVGEPGTPVWFEYAGAQPEVDFYAEMFGWGIDSQDSAIHVAYKDGGAIAWFWQIDAEPHNNWVVYFGVEDLAATLAGIDSSLVVQQPQESFLGPTAVVRTPAGHTLGLAEVPFQDVEEETIHESDDVFGGDKN